VVELALAGANLEARNKGGDTPLIAASHNGYEKIVTVRWGGPWCDIQRGMMTCGL
jgi:hypothetical protein